MNWDIFPTKKWHFYCIRILTFKHINDRKQGRKLSYTYIWPKEMSISLCKVWLRMHKISLKILVPSILEKNPQNFYTFSLSLQTALTHMQTWKSAQLAGGLRRSQITKDTVIERKIFADNSLGELTYHPHIALKNISLKKTVMKIK
jgi:hypothetical protein